MIANVAEGCIRPRFLSITVAVDWCILIRVLHFGAISLAHLFRLALKMRIPITACAGIRVMLMSICFRFQFSIAVSADIPGGLYKRDYRQGSCLYCRGQALRYPAHASSKYKPCTML